LNCWNNEPKKLTPREYDVSMFSSYLPAGGDVNHPGASLFGNLIGCAMQISLCNVTTTLQTGQFSLILKRGRRAAPCDKNNADGLRAGRIAAAVTG
jgi:hypothetical protein